MGSPRCLIAMRDSPHLFHSFFSPILCFWSALGTFCFYHKKKDTICKWRMITFSTLPLSFECFYSKSSMLNWDNKEPFPLQFIYLEYFYRCLHIALLWEFAAESMRDSLSLSMNAGLTLLSFFEGDSTLKASLTILLIAISIEKGELGIQLKAASLPHLSILLFQTHSASSSAGGHYDQGSSFSLISFPFSFHLMTERNWLQLDWYSIKLASESHSDSAIRTHLAQFVHFSFSHFWHFNCRSDWMTKCDLGLLCGNYYYCLRQWCQWWFTV